MRHRASFERRFQALANECPWAEMQLLGIEDDALKETIRPSVLKRYNRRLEKAQAILCAIVCIVTFCLLDQEDFIKAGGLLVGSLMLAYLIQGLPRVLSACLAKRADGLETRPANIPLCRNTRLFMLFMDQDSAEVLVGDLEERYALMRNDYGYETATFWFYREVLDSFLSLAFTALKRISRLEDLLRRIGSS
jgi:hypothetical protein